MQVLLAAGEDLTNQCINADVFYGDTQLSQGVVRTTPQKTAPDAEASVRIQAATPINEPFVTLYVRAGCDTAFTRRFVLLADPLTEPVASASRAAPAATVVPAAPAQAQAQAPGAAASPARSEGAGAGMANRSASPSSGRAAPSPAARAPSPQASARANPAGRSNNVVRRPAPAPAAPRLQLDPVDVDPGIERDPTLRLSPLLLSEANASEEARAAAGMLWKAINASPEEILRDAQQVAALEAEANRLRAASAQSQSSIAELNAQLEQARDQRYRNWLVYLLGGLLLLALLALLLLSRRRQADAGSDASRAWWSGTPDGKSASAAPPRSTERKGARKPAAQAVPDTAVDLHLDQDSSLDDLQPLSEPPPQERSAKTDSVAPLQSKDRKEFSSSALGVSRSVATEELFDVQQQADFFVSLGEDEQAIQVLRNHLAESHEPSPLAYLDLFKLYHRLGRRDEYHALRDEFNHVFNAGAPPFNQYTDGGRGLESYESAFSRIQSLWPQPRVLDLIEESIFRDVSDDEVEVFDLEAYRELLLLHAIAKELIKRDDPPAAVHHSEFGHTSMQPLKAQVRRAGPSTAARQEATVGRNTEPMPMDTMLPVSSHIGLDINLNDLSEFSAFEASLPEVTPPVEPTARPVDDNAPPLSNLIDFEVLDFMPPEDESSAKPDNKR